MNAFTGTHPAFKPHSLRCNGMFILSLALWATVPALGTSAPVTTGEVVFNSFNFDATLSNPSLLPVFTLQSRQRITSIWTYHWNDGTGQDPALVNGHISIFDQQSGLLIGSWKADDIPIGPANTLWQATPDVLLPPGEYRIEDSDRTTWSYTVTDFFGTYGENWEPEMGFALVRAVPESSSANAAGLLPVVAAMCWLRRRRPTDVRQPRLGDAGSRS